LHGVATRWYDRRINWRKRRHILCPEAYQSGNADFVITFQSDPAGAGAAVRSLGYRDMGDTYRHDRNVFTLEFPPGPLAVGDDLIRSYETVTRGQEILYVLSRTDCVRDRLAFFYFFADRSALAAAVAVAARPVDLALIERWSNREGQASRFAEFLGYRLRLRMTQGKLQPFDFARCARYAQGDNVRRFR
jgi:hypothetical protein